MNIVCMDDICRSFPDRLEYPWRDVKSTSWTKRGVTTDWDSSTRLKPLNIWTSIRSQYCYVVATIDEALTQGLDLGLDSTRTRRISRGYL